MSDIATLSQTIITALTKSNQTLSAAESCTGGLLSACLTDVPGSSAAFFGGIIAYDNSVKTGILKVAEKTLADHGAVSEECALEMAYAVRSLFHVSAGISITGIAGPGGGTGQKPVGTVYIAAIYEEKKSVVRYQFQGDRAAVRLSSVKAALEQFLSLFPSNAGCS